MRIAVIDLGTNTCNLLIAEHANGGHTILHQSKQLVKLGDGRIKDNEISQEATERTLNSFRIHKSIISKFDVEQVRVIATSAVRTAENKIGFLEDLGEDSGWLVKIVTGETEAQLIFKGVLLAFKALEQPAAILDIGGGSNEVILACQKEMLWKESQPAGMARVINQFNLSDPILPEQISELQSYFYKQHAEAIKNCKAKQVRVLIGCSGAFDTIVDMIDEIDPGVKQRTSQKIELNDFNNVYNRLIKSTRDERLNMKGVDYVRVDLIVPAVILMKLFITEIGIGHIYQTDYALREGVLAEMIAVGKMLFS